MTTLNPLTVCITTNWKIRKKDRGIPEHFTSLLRNLYSGQEATVRTGYGIMGETHIKAEYCHPAYSTYTMWNAGLHDCKAGIKIERRNTNNLRYTGDTTLMAESEEALRDLLMRVKKETEKAGLKLNIQNTKITASSPITSWQIDGETVTFYFLGL